MGKLIHYPTIYNLKLANHAVKFLILDSIVRIFIINFVEKSNFFLNVKCARFKSIVYVYFNVNKYFSKTNIIFKYPNFHLIS